MVSIPPIVHSFLCPLLAIPRQGFLLMEERICMNFIRSRRENKIYVEIRKRGKVVLEQLGNLVEKRNEVE